MSNKYNLFISTGLIIVLSGCVLSTEPYRSVSHHDLGIPSVKDPDGPTVKITKFKLNGPYIFKMIFRAENNKLKIDEYNKWAQVPEQMLSRYLTIAFSGKSKNNNSFTVSGTILAFEGDYTSGNAIMTVEYEIRESQGEKRKVSFCETFTEKMDKVTPGNLSSAMAGNVAKFADRIREEIKKMD